MTKNKKQSQVIDSPEPNQKIEDNSNDLVFVSELWVRKRNMKTKELSFFGSTEDEFKKWCSTNNHLYIERRIFKTKCSSCKKELVGKSCTFLPIGKYRLDDAETTCQACCEKYHDHGQKAFDLFKHLKDKGPIH